MAAAFGLGNLCMKPGTRAAALRGGAIPAMVSLLRAGDRECIEVAGCIANFLADPDAPAALLATDFSARATTMLSDEFMCGLKGDFEARPPERQDQTVTTLTNFVMLEIVPASVLISTGAAARLAQIARGGYSASDFATELLLGVATLCRSTFDAMAASGTLRAVLDAFVDPSASDRLLFFAAKSLSNALFDPSSWVPGDTLSRGGPGIDRDCRQALARFLLSPANVDVFRRLDSIRNADKAGAAGNRGTDCAAYFANIFLHNVTYPGAVGPGLALEMVRHVMRVIPPARYAPM